MPGPQPLHTSHSSERQQCHGTHRADAKVLEKFAEASCALRSHRQLSAKGYALAPGVRSRLELCRYGAHYLRCHATFRRIRFTYPCAILAGVVVSYLHQLTAASDKS